MKNGKLLFSISAALAASLLVAEEIATSSQELVLPVVPEPVFKELGRYRVSGATHLKLGKATDIPKGDFVFQVFTDGIDVRICPEGEEESYIAFQIYQDGGIYDESGENLLQGVMAVSDQGEVLRQICIEPRMLVLTKFPTSTSSIEVTYALRETE